MAVDEGVSRRTLLARETSASKTFKRLAVADMQRQVAVHVTGVEAQEISRGTGVGVTPPKCNASISPQVVGYSHSCAKELTGALKEKGKKTSPEPTANYFA